MKQKLIALFMVVIMVLSFPIAAAEDVPSRTTTDEIDQLPGAGTTPDSALYFLDTAMENIALALTFDVDKKIEKRLAIAKERLSEAREMAKNGNVDAMKKAQEEHDELFDELRENIEGIENGSIEGEFKKEFNLERKIREHQDLVHAVEDELRVKIILDSEMTDEAKESLREILDLLEDRAGELIIEIKNERSKTEVKYEHEYGEEPEYEYEDDYYDEEYDLEYELEEAERFLNALKKYAQEENVELPEKAMNEVMRLLKASQKALEAGDYYEAEDLMDEGEEIFEDEIEPLVEDFMERYFRALYGEEFEDWEESWDTEDYDEQGFMTDLMASMNAFVVDIEEKSEFSSEDLSEVRSLLAQAQAALDKEDFEEADELLWEAEEVFFDLAEDRVDETVLDELYEKHFEEFEYGDYEEDWDEDGEWENEEEDYYYYGNDDFDEEYSHHYEDFEEQLDGYVGEYEDMIVAPEDFDGTEKEYLKHLADQMEQLMEKHQVGPELEDEVVYELEEIIDDSMDEFSDFEDEEDFDDYDDLKESNEDFDEDDLDEDDFDEEDYDDLDNYDSDKDSDDHEDDD